MSTENKPTGHSVSYYVVDVRRPNQGVIPYTAECGDIIESLGMTFAEGCAFKGIWRSAAARTLGKRKTDGQDALYDAQKVEFYGRRMQADLGSHPVVTMKDWQAQVSRWGYACFGDQSTKKEDRRNRFMEESLELVQSLGGTASDCHKLVDYVFARPVGEAHWELGGVLLTVAMLANANDLSMNLSSSAELVRVYGKIDKIRAKDAAKPKEGPLPGPTDGIAAGIPGKMAVVHLAKNEFAHVHTNHVEVPIAGCAPPVQVGGGGVRGGVAGGHVNGASFIHYVPEQKFVERQPIDVARPLRRAGIAGQTSRSVTVEFNSNEAMQQGMKVIQFALTEEFNGDGYSLNSRKSVAVSTTTRWKLIDEHTPRGVKMQLISKASGVATYGVLTSVVEHFTHWAPMPAWDGEEV